MANNALADDLAKLADHLKADLVDAANMLPHVIDHSSRGWRSSATHLPTSARGEDLSELPAPSRSETDPVGEMVVDQRRQPEEEDNAAALALLAAIADVRQLARDARHIARAVTGASRATTSRLPAVDAARRAHKAVTDGSVLAAKDDARRPPTESDAA